MNTLPVVLLRPGEADRVVAGHPWIYQGSIFRLTAPAGAAKLVLDPYQTVLTRP